MSKLGKVRIDKDTHNFIQQGNFPFFDENFKLIYSEELKDGSLLNTYESDCFQYQSKYGTMRYRMNVIIEPVYGANDEHIASTTCIEVQPIIIDEENPYPPVTIKRTHLL